MNKKPQSVSHTLRLRLRGGMWAPNDSNWQREYLGFEPYTADEMHAQMWTTTNAQRAADSAESGSVHPEAAANAACSECEDNDKAEMGAMRVPTAEELPAWIALVVRHHGAQAVVAQLIKVCPAAIMQDACDLAWGIRSDDASEQFARVRASSRSIACSLTRCRCA